MRSRRRGGAKAWQLGFTEYRGFGFWSWDSYLEHVAGEIAEVIFSKKERENWLRVVTEKQIVDGPLHKTSTFLLRLLDGQIERTAASPLDYMVEGDRAYLRKP